MENTNKLELHFLFNDDSHTIDAFVLQKCENEILTITKDIITSFNYEIDILSEASKEGGFKEYWKLMGKNNNQLTLILALVVLIVTNIPKSNSELERLQKENLKLDNEEKRLKIEQLKKELNIQNNDKQSTILNDAAIFFNSDYKIIKHKSNFYHNLQGYSKITEITTRTYNENQPISEPYSVKRADFHKFILATNKLPEIIIEDAIIEIISPVLKKGKYKWKGIYEGNTIDFEMKDNSYKTQVSNKEVTFHSGFFIQCVFKITRIINDIGIIQNTGYIVQTVIGKIDNNTVIETEEGKKHKKTQYIIKGQTKLL